MVTFLVILQILVAIFLVLVVLLQPGNKGGVGAALGGAGGDTVFGGRGANSFLAKLTVAAAAVFMISNFSLSFLSTPHSSVKKSVLEELAKEQAAAVPAATSATPAVAVPPAPAEAAPGTAAKPEAQVESK